MLSPPRPHSRLTGRGEGGNAAGQVSSDYARTGFGLLDLLTTISANTAQGIVYQQGIVTES
ncbi:hypothetical protein E2C01_051843 [Portunus trituberculatus]|uniref:Uncharacterized protein n=1 Tax=Portunus trituberculatus TaxID=210409 RepID=A0A5B7GMU0_PORTR|nr:hypothetical protein [Portunus trituberculatus]